MSLALQDTMTIDQTNSYSTPVSSSSTDHFIKNDDTGIVLAAVAVSVTEPGIGMTRLEAEFVKPTGAGAEELAGAEIIPRVPAEPDKSTVSRVTFAEEPRRIVVSTIGVKLLESDRPLQAEGGGWP